ncbi:MAG: C40 family peptidase [Elusimicrobia bacterium]|nr:C40 family peptidase [Elusimicrobiota bacterium]
MSSLRAAFPVLLLFLPLFKNPSFAQDSTLARPVPRDKANLEDAERKRQEAIRQAEEEAQEQKRREYYERITGRPHPGSPDYYDRMMEESRKPSTRSSSSPSESRPSVSRPRSHDNTEPVCSSPGDPCGPSYPSSNSYQPFPSPMIPVSPALPGNRLGPSYGAKEWSLNVRRYDPAAGGRFHSLSEEDFCQMIKERYGNNYDPPPVTEDGNRTISKSEMQAMIRDCDKKYGKPAGSPDSQRAKPHQQSTSAAKDNAPVDDDVPRRMIDKRSQCDLIPDTYRYSYVKAQCLAGQFENSPHRPLDPDGRPRPQPRPRPDAVKTAQDGQDSGLLDSLSRRAEAYVQSAFVKMFTATDNDPAVAVAPAVAQRLRELTVQSAQAFDGKPYGWRGASLHEPPGGFDCSGFAYEIIYGHGRQSADKRLSADGYFKESKDIKAILPPGAMPQPGDVFFKEEPSGKMGHMGVVESCQRTGPQSMQCSVIHANGGPWYRVPDGSGGVDLLSTYEEVRDYKWRNHIAEIPNDWAIDGSCAPSTTFDEISCKIEKPAAPWTFTLQNGQWQRVVKNKSGTIQMLPHHFADSLRMRGLKVNR